MRRNRALEAYQDKVDKAVHNLEAVLSDKLYCLTHKKDVTPPITPEGWEILAIAYVELRLALDLPFEGSFYQDGAYSDYKAAKRKNPQTPNSSE